MPSKNGHWENLQKRHQGKCICLVVSLTHDRVFHAGWKQMLRTQHAPNTGGCVGCAKFCPSNGRVHAAAGGHKDGMGCSKYHWASTAEPSQHSWTDLLILLVSVFPLQPELEQSSSNWHFQFCIPSTDPNDNLRHSSAKYKKRNTSIYTLHLKKKLIRPFSSSAIFLCCKNKAGSNAWRREVPIV